MKRSTGFYWVKTQDGWTIGEYFDDGWNLFEDSLVYIDENFDEIDERKIERNAL